jgi:signal transduction histidine kinase
VKRFHTRWAFALTAAAVLIPAGAWYLIGARQLTREAEQLLEVARHESSSSAERMAAQLAIRLEEIVDSESNRPYVHYWRQFVSRGEACADPRVRWSPLAWGKRHKLIAAHFLVDQHGRLTSPERSVDVQAIDFADPTAAASRSPALPTSPAGVPAAFPAAMIAGPPPAASMPATVMLPAAITPDVPRAEPDQGAQVMPFRWQTGSWEGKPALMAVRQVISAGDTSVQGFVVDSNGLSHWLYELGSPAILLPGEPRGETEARVPILGATWHIQVEPAPRLERAVKRAAVLSRQFHQSYFGGVLGAMLAGLCLVVLIRRSERLAEERSRFAAAAAHELRTPLAGIRLHGEMLALSLGNPRRVTEYAARITDEAERLTRLVSNVFSYTQVDQKLLRIHTEPGDIGQAVREALTLVHPIVERMGAEVVLRVEHELPPVSFDKDAVHQMVRNLVDNAEKYSRGCSDRRIEVEVTSCPEAALLTVRDHGPGIPPSDRVGIFQPFSRHARSTEISGLGLGLAVVRTLALAHGGRVDYRDADGGGASFTVRFPQTQAEAPLTQPGPQPA